MNIYSVLFFGVRNLKHCTVGGDLARVAYLPAAFAVEGSRFKYNAHIVSLACLADFAVGGEKRCHTGLALRLGIAAELGFCKVRKGALFRAFPA